MNKETIKLVCLYGPESTGKSTLAKRLAAHYRTEFVPEVAREIVQSNRFTVEDIVRIARTQTDRVFEKLKTARRVLFCDTDVITTAIYSEVYLHTIPAELAELERRVRYDQYFLFDVDVPWVADGLRDLQDERVEMFERFKEELERRKLSYIRISGNYEEREKRVIDFTDRMLAAS